MSDTATLLLQSSYLSDVKVCSNCGSDKTYMNRRYGKHGQLWLTADWRKDEEGNTLCKNCYHELISTYESRKEWFKKIGNPRTHAKWIPRRFHYKGEAVYADHNVRTGICSQCYRSIQKGEIQKTNLHHLKYDDSDTLKHTIELCVRCHMRIHTAA